MIQTAGGTSWRNVWDKKSKLIPLENNLKAMFLRLLGDLIQMGLL